MFLMNMKHFFKFQLALSATEVENTTENGIELFQSVFRFKGFTMNAYTDKKENKIFLIYREIQIGAVAKSHMRKGFLIFEEMRKYLVIYEEAVSHI